MTMYNNKIIYSISPKYYPELKIIIENDNPRNKEEIKNVLNKYFKYKKEKINIQEMSRMTKNEKINVDTADVINIKEENKEEYFNSFDYHQEKIYKENKWKQIKRYKYLNGIVKDGKIVSLGFISNVDYNVGNIVIQTKEKYQNKGYGTAIVEKISNDLLENEIIPIYLVNKNNKESIKLANKVSFKVKASEIVVKINN